MSQLTEENTSKFVQTSRWKLHYNEAGEGHAVILLHGTGPGGSGWSNYSQNFPELSKHFRVIALDFPGWGKSDVFDCTGESRNAANAEAVKLLMDELGIEKAALVGNSMGGAAVLDFMAAYPDRISHAITMGSGLFATPGVLNPGGLGEGLRVIVGAYRDPSPENFKRLVDVMVYDPAFSTEALAKQRSDDALARPEHLSNWLKWPMGHPKGPFGGVEELMTALQKSQVPTLLIHGRDDRTISLEISLRTSGIIPNSRVLILNRCGHWAQVEHRDEFDRAVIGFLKA
jgi:2-hydroxy-6-oxonona-2,4-dienedioate hydrolase